MAGTAQRIAERHSPRGAETVGPFPSRRISTRLALHGIPDAAVALVKGSEILYLGGYGQADLQQGEPVSAETTLFRTGSVSKSFTWTAVLLQPPLSAALTCLTLVPAVVAWRRSHWGLASRLYHLRVSLLGLAFLGSLYYWNLMGPGL